MQEGRALAQSQSDMERTLRRVRADHRTALEERDKARAEAAAAAEAKADAKAAAKSVAALQAAAQTAATRIAGLEKEVLTLKTHEHCLSKDPYSRISPSCGCDAKADAKAAAKSVAALQAAAQVARLLGSRSRHDQSSL